MPQGDKPLDNSSQESPKPKKTWEELLSELLAKDPNFLENLKFNKLDSFRPVGGEVPETWDQLKAQWPLRNPDSTLQAAGEEPEVMKPTTKPVLPLDFVVPDIAQLLAAHPELLKNNKENKIIFNPKDLSLNRKEVADYPLKSSLTGKEYVSYDEMMADEDRWLKENKENPNGEF